MKLRGLLRVMCFLSILLAAVGCGTMRAYKGPSRPENEVALILRSASEGNGWTYIHRVDGKGLGFSPSAEVLPGKHRVEWECHSGMLPYKQEFRYRAYKYYTIKGKTDFYAEPGEMYELRGLMKFTEEGKAYVTVKPYNIGKYSRQLQKAKK